MATVTQLYIEKCRSKLSARLGKEATDYQLCKTLGISSSAMTNYTKHDREADDEAAFKIAQFAQVPPMEVIGAIHAKKAKTDEVRNFWESVRKGSAASIAGLVITGSLLAPTQSEACSQFNISDKPDIYYTNI